MTQHTNTSTDTLTTHEHIVNGDDHVIVHTSPGGTQITGYRGGEWIEEAWPTPPVEDDVPVADGLSDITTREVPLRDGHVTVEHFYGHDGGRAEVTIWLGGALRSSLILTAAEGEALGMALARPYGFTVGDYWDLCDRLGTGGQR